MISLILRPVRHRPGIFDAIMDGERIVRSRQPLYDGARALQARGHDPDEMIEARHEGSAIVAMRSTIGEAARWSVTESDKGGIRRIPYQPFDRAALLSGVDQIGVSSGVEVSEGLEDAA